MSGEFTPEDIEKFFPRVYAEPTGPGRTEKDIANYRHGMGQTLGIVPKDTPAPYTHETELKDPDLGPDWSLGRQWDEIFPRAYPEAPFGEKVATAGEQFAIGAVEHTAPLSGMVMGAKIGMAAPPPHQVWTVPLLAAGGLFAGHLFKEEAKKTFGAQDPDQYELSLRPWAYGGRLAGEALPFSLGTSALAATDTFFPEHWVGRQLNKIIESAQRNPKSFLFGEGSMAVGAGVAGGVYESYRPGRPLERMGAEFVGGFFNLTRILTAAATYGVDTARKALFSWTRTGRENEAARTLLGILEDFGEDPELLAKMLRLSGIEGTNITSATRTGSPALMALEAEFARTSVEFGKARRDAVQGTMESMRQLVVAMRGTGEPELVEAAMEIQRQYYQSLIDGVVEAAEQRAVQAASKISADRPQDRIELSRQATEYVYNSVRKVRAVESDLWENIDQNVPTAANNIFDAYKELKKARLPEADNLPPVVEANIAGWRKRAGDAIPDDDPDWLPYGIQLMSSGDLIRFRTRLLALARQASAKNDFDDAHAYGVLAEAALDDLNALPDGVTGYQAARDFSREFNDSFTRKYAGEVAARGRTGARRIPAELMVRSAMAQGGDAAGLRFQELREAVGFLASRGEGGFEALKDLAEFIDLQDRVFRLSIASSIREGRISKKAIDDIMDKQAVLLEAFPDVRKALEKARESEVEAQGIVDAIWHNKPRFQAQMQDLEKVTKIEGATQQINSLLSGRTPVRSLEGYIKQAKRSGNEYTIDGLKSALWDHAINVSSRVDGDVVTTDFQKLRQAMFNPIRPNQPSLVDVMKKYDLIDEGQIANLNKLFERADYIETALSTGREIENILGEADAITDLVIRITGARLGAYMGQGTSGSTLIAAGRGSIFMRNVFERIPNLKIKGVLIEAAKDPEFMATLLERGVNERDKIRIARQIHGYLIAAGLIGIEDAAEAATRTEGMEREQ